MNRNPVRPFPPSQRLVAAFYAPQKPSLAFRDCPPVCGSSRKKVIRHRSASVADSHGIPSRRTEEFGLIKNGKITLFVSTRSVFHFITFPKISKRILSVALPDA
jgi:hypothetical protein